MAAIRVPHQDHYGMESYQLIGEIEDRRVHYEGAWYYFKGIKGKKDILEKIPVEVLKAERDKVNAEEELRIKAKGHDCDDFVCHGMYARENGSLNDYYYCGQCNDLLQTG